MIHAPRALAALNDIAEDFDAILCDIWGVIHNGRAVYADACAALQAFRDRGKVVVLISNVPKPRDPIPGQLTRLGAPECWDAIVTSGDAIRAELRDRAPGPMLKIGPSGDAVLWEGLGLDRTPQITDAAFFAISGLNDDTRETPEDYLPLLRQAQAKGLDFLCANPDIVVQRGDRLVWCAGAVAREYEKLGGRVVMAGKPYAPIYELAYKELARLGAGAVPRERILAIGDGLGTDVKGANAQGLPCLFIASGVHGEAFAQNGVLDLEAAAAELRREGAKAAYAMATLR